MSMRRWTVGAAVIGLLVVLPVPAAASDSSTGSGGAQVDGGVGADGSTAVIEGNAGAGGSSPEGGDRPSAPGPESPSGGGPSGGGDGAGGGSSGGSGGNAADDAQQPGLRIDHERSVWAYEPSWSQDEDTGAPCILLSRRVGVEVDAWLAMAWEQRILTMIADPRLDGVADRFCPGAQVLAATPRAAAEHFIRTIGLPEPEVAIPPGFALTGLPMFLIIANQAAFTVAEDLGGWGRMSVTLRPVVFEVAWGDGTTVTVDDGRTGAPYGGEASQQIRHTYQEVDLDTEVVVTARWQAEWRVAGFAGTLRGLVIEQVTPLPVREYRAVRVSP